MKRLAKYWHKFWFNHFLDVLCVQVEGSIQKLVEDKMNYHWHLYMAHTQYIKGRKKK
jgi:hypothetical protein